MGFALALAVAVALVPSTTPAASCEDYHVFRYCGEYPASLPMTFSYQSAGAPAVACDVDARVNGIGPCDMATTIRLAMQAWNSVWPGGLVCSPLCLGANGAHTIRWGGAGGNVAETTLEYESGTSRIKRVTITLNSAKSWRFAGGVSLAYGATGAASGGVLRLGEWYDVESVVLHELGHALGLEDIGSHQAPFPSDLRDAARYQQVMYAWYYPASVKRALAAGDIAGVQRVAIDAVRRP